MKNILLLTDFSENALNAIEYSMNLFEGDRCHFFILHVKSPAAYTTDDIMASGNESIYNIIVKNPKEELESMVLDLKAYFKTETFEFETIVDYDNLTAAINQAVNVKSIDLIVMGTNGVTGAKEVIFGSNTVNVIRNINCPTLVIPEDFVFRNTNEILLPLDVQDALSGKAFSNTSKFAERFSKKIHVLRIKPNSENSPEEKKDIKQLSYFLKKINSEYHIVSDIPMNYVVDCYIQTHKIDLIVLLVQKETLLERFFIGSPTTKISNSIRVPLLVFHA
ncbi:universal stress protein [Psychroflexus sp. YR1-1]|uniref:Universal stress protein n=1 Tax=Psychroflexus aurantiacus TaxID=2709310 RepID=A0A6B3R2S9_9FLAO|nr:universal stress protein [Psychroflexus aurantiacus]NEV94959.1 universal stress protein [Psychroflexus aurantiacus]